MLTHGSVGQLNGAPGPRRAGLPSIWWYHGSGRWSARWRVAALLPAAAVVSVNDAMVEAQRQRTPRTCVGEVSPPEWQWTDIAAYRGAGRQVRETRGWKEHPVVGMVGRLERCKGHLTFLHAAAQVAEWDPQVRFAVVGGDVPGRRGRAHAAALRRTADELGLGERLHFAGDQDQPYAWLDAFDVAVHASDSEGFGMVVLEAMALGTPLIATDVPGPADIVEDGVSGLLVPAGEREVSLPGKSSASCKTGPWPQASRRRRGHGPASSRRMRWSANSRRLPLKSQRTDARAATRPLFARPSRRAHHTAARLGDVLGAPAVAPRHGRSALDQRRLPSPGRSSLSATSPPRRSDPPGWLDHTPPDRARRRGWSDRRPLERRRNCPRTCSHASPAARPRRRRAHCLRSGSARRPRRGQRDRAASGRSRNRRPAPPGRGHPLRARGRSRAIAC